MTKKEFIGKYPELSDGGEISTLKIELLKGYSTHSLSNGDNKIKFILEDYDNMIKSENRDKQISILLLESRLRKLKTSLTKTQP